MNEQEDTNPKCGLGLYLTFIFSYDVFYFKSAWISYKLYVYGLK